VLLSLEVSFLFRVQLQRGTSKSNNRRDSEEGESVSFEENKQVGPSELPVRVF